MTDTRRPSGEMSTPSIPLPYARREAPPPLDWTSILRQVVFSIGVGIASAALAYAFGDSSGRDAYPGVGIGMCLIALTLPFPGRIGRLRPQ
ncbi:MAG: hypothetical protein JWN24_4194 [Phycisphaerales bacterium]|nr:hypothetical protein [Phycisphaerales bacterium]